MNAREARRRRRRKELERPHQVSVEEAIAHEARRRSTDSGVSSGPPLVWAGLAEDPDPPPAFDELFDRSTTHRNVKGDTTP